MCCASRRRLLLQLGCSWASRQAQTLRKGSRLQIGARKHRSTTRRKAGRATDLRIACQSHFACWQLELRRPTNSTEASARVYQAAEGIGRCKYAVRAAHLALAEVKTLASTGKRGASFLPTAVLLRVVESSRHLLFLVRSAAERNRKFYALRAGHSHTRSPARYAVDRR